ncbi:MAG TPA: hypothetical protein VGG48_15360 [Rhizomicrobium sp.]|jgi:hypothetical protein
MPIADYAQNVQTPFFPMVRHDMAATRKSASAATAVPATPSAATTQTASAAPASPATSSSGKSFWQNVLDVVNPLEHLPVVSTIYRAITGDKPDTLEKIAGDTLYGGPLGLVSSLADLTFEKVTGKDFGDTVMGLFHSSSSNDKTATASTDKPLKPLPSRTVTASAVYPSAMLPTAPAVTAAPASLAAPVKTQTTAKPPVAMPAAADSNTQALVAAMNQNGVDSDLGMRALFAYQKSLDRNADGGPSAAP